MPLTATRVRGDQAASGASDSGPELLASALYDPAVAVSEATTALLGMTALDTANLRVTFTAPDNGTVRVKLRGIVHGASASPALLLGVLDGAVIRGRQAPYGARPINTSANAMMPQEAEFLVTGLTPGDSYTWDAAYGVEFAVAATGLKYGGPDDAVASTMFGAFSFEVWSTPNLLAGKLYDPAVASAADSTAAVLAMTAIDTANLRLAFTVPDSGRVRVKGRCMASGGTGIPIIALGVLSGAAVVARQVDTVFVDVGPFVATSHVVASLDCIVGGLAPGAALTWDLAYGVEVAGGAGHNIKFGGPNNAVQDDAYGGAAFEVYAA